MEMIEIEAFTAIARAGSFTRGAESLYISQPAISRRIDLLEQELGARLFERLHGGARLTEAGQAFLPFADQILVAARDGIEAVAALECEEQGMVTLGMVATLASTRLTARLQRFRESHPQVRVKLQTGPSDEISTMVRRGDVNLGLRYFPDTHPEIVSRTVAHVPLVIVCGAEHRLAAEQMSSPAGLAGIPWVSFPIGTGSLGEPYARLLEQQLQAVGLREGAEIIAIDSLTAQKRLIEAGFGLGMLPESGIEEEIRLGTLRRLDLPEMRTTAPVVAVYRRQGYLSKVARRLLAEIAGDI